jgi:hypothetical protein
MDYLLKRLQEASSYAGIATIVGGINNCLAGDYVTGIGMICAGIAAILIPGGRAD